MSAVEIKDNPAESRFEATLDGELVGIAEYQLPEGLIVFTHTEVAPAVEGHGTGSALAKYALDQVASTGTRKVVPLCPFIKRYISQHPEYSGITA